MGNGPRRARKIGRERERSPWALRPASNVRFLGSGVWLAKDNDPQFEIFPSDGPVRPGTYEISISTSDEAAAPLTPRIYFDHGNGYSEANATQLPTMHGTGTFLIEIPRRTHRIRFDPVAESGCFVLHDVTAHRVRVTETVAWISRQPGGKRRAIAALLRKGPLEAMRATDASASINFETTDYKSWLRSHEPSVEASAPRIRDHLQKLPSLPTISVVMAVYNSRPEWLRDAIQSLKNQVYPCWELCAVRRLLLEPRNLRSADGTCGRRPQDQGKATGRQRRNIGRDQRRARTGDR